MISTSFKTATVVAAGLVFNPPGSSAHTSHHDEVVYDLSKHHDFIMNMKLPNGTSRCCNGDDVFVDLEEIENPDGGYTVIVPAGTVLTRDSSGNPVMILDKEAVVVVPPSRVLMVDHANKICAELREKGSTTCMPPATNVLYAPPTSLGDPNPSTFCYVPVPKGF